VSIGREKAVVDEAVEAGRGDEDAAAALQAEVQNFQEECSKDLAVAEPVIAQAEAALNRCAGGVGWRLRVFCINPPNKLTPHA
jgi:hypothetical protein